MNDLRRAAVALRGEISGRQVLCPGVGHSAADRSLAVRFEPRAPEGFVVHSFSGDDPIEARDHVRDKLGLPRWRPDDGLDWRWRSITRSAAPRPKLEPPPIDDATRTKRALQLWHEATDPRGTVAWTYLFKRGVDLGALPDRIQDALRWHPSCPWDNGRHGCLVALWTNIITGEPRAIHRRAITPAGDSVGHWRALGPTTGCVIRLWPDECVTQGLVLGEGIETTLVAATRIAHRSTLLQPAWAAGDVGHLAALPVLAGIEALTLLVDHDDAGQRAADQCARRWTAAGREVVRLTPQVPKQDFADAEIAHG